MRDGLAKAADRGLACCHVCRRVAPVGGVACPRCGTRLHLRKEGSVQRTLALLAAAMALYVPSHLLPVMTVTELGVVKHSTIIAGMAEFWEDGDIPIALIIFTASILIPLLKVGALLWLCAAASGRVACSPESLVRLHWVTELLGRWSMVDIFVVGILVSLVQLGNVMTIMPGPGALAFAGVVLLSMIAAMGFDPRLLWDRLDNAGAGDAPERRGA
jgi:paraquat-inducible protein A